MRRLVLMFALLLLALPGAAQPKCYFYAVGGGSLRYERYDASDGKLWWIHNETINSINSTSDGGRSMDITTHVISKAGKSPVKEPVMSTVIIKPDGTVVADVAKASEEAARQMLSAFDFTSSGDASELPPTLAPGDVLKEIHTVVSWAGIKFTIDYDNRKVTRRETITVPAGTFDCIVVEEHKKEKAPFHRRERNTVTWYALGYGMIRHDTFFTDGRQETTEVLVSFGK